MNAPADPAFAQRCRESFGHQKAMALIGARVARRQGAGGEARPHTRHCAGEVYADDGKHVATMLQTLMMLADTPDTPL